MLTKKQIDTLKSDNLQELYDNLRNVRANRSVLYILENLGKLPKGFEGDILLPFLDHEYDAIRLSAVKNIGKLGDTKYLDYLAPIALNDSDSMVRREAVSSIGRMRDRAIIQTLFECLDDNDPKIVLQAIRGLLTFKSNPLIEEKLKKLHDHPNEMISEVITRELLLHSEKLKPKYPHTVVPDFMKNTVVHGDVLDILDYVPNESIHLTFTSPPYYNARDYSIYVSYEQYLDFLTDVFRKIHRVTKEGRYFILNTSPIIIPRFSRAYSSKRYPIPFDIHPRLTEMGWEFIDDIVWAKPEASVKNRNAGFLQHRKPLAYKPNATTEYLMVYRKKSEKLLDWNIRQYSPEIVEQSKVLGDYETSNLWEIDPTFDKVHSAVFPTELCNRVIRYYSFIGDLVFDPFGGSGTLSKTAHQLERYFFTTEKDDTYINRLRDNLSNLSLFNTQPICFHTLEAFKKIAGKNQDET